MILAAITLSDLAVVVMFYLIGWLGAFLLLSTVVYALSAIWRMYRYSDKPNHCKVLKGFMDYYRWLGIDWIEGPAIHESRIPFSVMSVMALFASLGTLAFCISFGFAVFVFIVIFVWSFIKSLNNEEV